MPLKSKVNKQVEAFIKKRTPVWNRWLQQLIQIPSPFEEEKAVLKKVEAILRELSAPRLHKVPHDAKLLARLPKALKPFSRKSGRYSLVAIAPGTSSGKSLALNAHLDTTLPGCPMTWSHPAFSGHIDSKRKLIYGRGSMDNKSGVVIALGVLDLALNGPLRLKGDLQLHLVLEDETTGNGTLLCLKAGHRTDAAFIIDGTRLDRAIREHAGQLHFSVAVFGKPASVSVSHTGINAAEMAAELGLYLKKKIHALNRSRSSQWRIFPSPFQCSLQNITCSVETFITPGHAKGEWFVTFCPPYTLKHLTKQIETWISTFAKKKKLPYPPVFERSGYEAEPVRSKSKAIESMLHRHGVIHRFPAINIGVSTGTSDLRHYVDAGIPALLYGPGRGYQPHQADEHYYLEDLPHMVGLYAGIAGDWCGLESDSKS